MALLERLGCPVKVERGDRVFPVSEKASDVTRALEKELRRLGVSIRLNTKVSHILVENGAVCVVCEKKPETDIAYVLVPDARAALAALGAYVYVMNRGKGGRRRR